MSREERNRKALQNFAGAWSRKDVAGLLTCCAPDVVYSASVGPEPGRTYRGHAEVARGFADILAYDRSLSNETLWSTFSGDRAYVAWSYRVPCRAGEKTILGFDMFAFSDGLITLKDAYRKVESSS